MKNLLIGAISGKEEWSLPPADCSFDEAFDKILNGLKICKAKNALKTHLKF